jgi:hypothetical protein
MMRGLVTIHTKQHWDYQLSILNSRPEFLHAIHPFVTPRCKQCRELQLSVLCINDGGESIKNHKYFCEFEAKFEKPPSDSEEVVWEELIPEKISGKKISLDRTFIICY